MKTVSFIISILSCILVFDANSQDSNGKSKKMDFYTNSGICFNKYDYSINNVRQNNSISSSVGMGILSHLSPNFGIKTGFEFINLKTIVNQQRVFESFFQIPLMLTCTGMNICPENTKFDVRLNASLGGYYSSLLRQGIANMNDAQYTFGSSSNSYAKVGYLSEIFVTISSTNNTKMPGYQLGIRGCKDISPLTHTISGTNTFYDKYSTAMVFVGLIFKK